MLRRRASRWWRLGAGAAAALAVVLGAPSLARAPARLLEGCLGWVAAGTGLELLSIVSFMYRAISLSVPLCVGGVAWIERLVPHGPGSVPGRRLRARPDGGVRRTEKAH